MTNEKIYYDFEVSSEKTTPEVITIVYARKRLLKFMNIPYKTVDFVFEEGWKIDSIKGIYLTRVRDKKEI